MADYIIRLLGGVDKFLSALIVFMVINYIAEMLLVIVVEEKRSNVFLLKNMFKKAAIFILVIVSIWEPREQHKALWGQFKT